MIPLGQARQVDSKSESLRDPPGVKPLQISPSQSRIPFPRSKPSAGSPYSTSQRRMLAYASSSSRHADCSAADSSFLGLSVTDGGRCSTMNRDTRRLRVRLACEIRNCFIFERVPCMSCNVEIRSMILLLMRSSAGARNACSTLLDAVAIFCCDPIAMFNTTWPESFLSIVHHHQGDFRLLDPGLPAGGAFLVASVCTAESRR
jgi:hypothetical protein